MEPYGRSRASTREPPLTTDTSSARRFGGTGLGRAICKKLIETFGGTLNVESRVGKGSVFRFTLPTSVGSQSDLKEEPQKTVMDKRMNGLRVLLAEDHDMNVFLAKTILEGWGVEVVVAENGKQAVQKINEQHFDLVLMDMQMPVMSGMEATEIIRQELGNPIPIIALTANARTEDNEKCLNAGMNDYISKPFQPEQLFAKMSVLVKSGISSGNQQTVPTMETTMQAPLFDLSKLRAMAGNDSGFVRKMVSMFMEQTPGTVELIQNSLEKKDYAQVKRLAHKMKPSIDFMGITALHSDIRAIEKFAETETNLDQLPGLIRKLDELCAKACEQLADEVQ